MINFKELNALDRARILFSTFFFIGYVPFAPGTVGTLPAVFIYLLLARFFSHGMHLLVLMILLVLGLWSSNFAEKYFSSKDPKPVVIDEMVGFLMAMLFLPLSFFTIISGFIIFRILDIVKAPPASLLEKLEGGAGIICDDLVAGFYTNILMRLLLIFLRAT